MNTIHLDVKGMSCGGCVKSVTAALTRLPGVSIVDVDLPTGHVTVNSDMTQGGEALVLALASAGYPASLTSATTATSPVKNSGGCCG